jgi:hypothetical protein
MPKKYKSHDGSYLDIDEQNEKFYIAWYLPEDGEFGAYCGDRALEEGSGETDDDKKAIWEINTADKAVKPFSCGNTNFQGFEFETLKQAKLALLAANTSLLNEGAPMPEWAIRASEAGWKPPKGWKP